MLTPGTAIRRVGLFLVPVLVLPMLTGPANAAPRDREAAIADRGTVRLIQANIRSGMAKAAFRNDVARVMAKKPDFVTYNEVPCRADADLAPRGYAIARPALTACRPRTERRWYERSSPVAWRTDRWDEVDRGTWTITNQGGRSRGSNIHLGIRVANWVTLRERGSDRVVSVVSAHFAPYRLGLTRTSVRRTGKLVAALRKAGPVLVGGDLNHQYAPRDTQASPLREHSLVPTFDETGPPAKGTRPNGQTIDFVLRRPANKWEVRRQKARPMRSDHHALIVDLEPRFGTRTGAVTAGNFRSKPSGTSRQRRAAIRSLSRTIGMAPRGSTVRLETVRLGRHEVVRALRDAHARGVNVQVLTRARPNPRERALSRHLGRKVTKGSWAKRSSPRARRIAKRRGAPPTRLMLTRSGTESKVLVHLSRRVTAQMLRRPTTIKVRTGGKAYRRHLQQFRRMQGR